MKKQNWREADLDNYLTAVDIRIDGLVEKGYTIDQAIEIVKVAVKLQDGDYLDENLMGIGEALEEISVQLSNISNSIEEY